MFAESKRSPIAHTLSRLGLGRLAVGLAAALLLVATGCIAEVEADGTPQGDDPTLAPEGTHIDGEPTAVSAKGSTGGGVIPNPLNPPGGPQAPPEPEPSPWASTSTNAVAGPGAAASPSMLRAHTPAGMQAPSSPGSNN